MNIQDAVKLAAKRKYGNYEIRDTITVEGIELKVYEACVVPQEVLLFGDNGTVTLMVDIYGDRWTYEIFDWEIDEARASAEDWNEHFVKLWHEDAFKGTGLES